MTLKVSHTAEIQSLFNQAAGLNSDQGSPRVKQIMMRLINNAARILEGLEISDDEFWHAVDYLNHLGGRCDAGLLVPGLSLEHFLDILQGAAAAQVRGVPGSRFAELAFDFQLQKAPAPAAEQRSKRPRAMLQA